MRKDRSPVAVITGASRGLGLARALGAGRPGLRLVIDARGGEALERARAELVRATDVRAIAGDVADEPHRVRLIEETASLGGLDLVVNNASLLGPSPQPNLAEYPLDDAITTGRACQSVKPTWSFFAARDRSRCRPADTSRRSSSPPAWLRSCSTTGTPDLGPAGPVGMMQPSMIELGVAFEAA